MGYYFEIWLRGFAKDYLRRISSQDAESYHPHVTFVRPFDIVSSEEVVMGKVVSFCEGVEPIPFYLEGVGDFDGKFYHVPVFEDGRLMSFNDGLEDVLSEDVKFVKKIDSVKNFHATVNDDVGDFDCPRIYQHMLRLTGIRDGKIWGSYDFVTGEVLNREESLDKGRWYESVHRFDVA